MACWQYMQVLFIRRTLAVVVMCVCFLCVCAKTPHDTLGLSIQQTDFRHSCKNTAAGCYFKHPAAVSMLLTTMCRKEVKIIQQKRLNLQSFLCRDLTYFL